MDPKLKTNLVNAPKMASVWVMTGTGAIATGILSWFFGLSPVEQTSMLNAIPHGAWLVPLLPVILGIYARVKPQAGITPEVAAAKSETPSVQFPMETGPAPLPAVPPADDAHVAVGATLFSDPTKVKQ